MNLADPGQGAVKGLSPDESALDEAAAFRDLFDNAPCGYLCVGPDDRIVRANRLCARWLGVPVESLIGRRLASLLTAASRLHYETHLTPLLRQQGGAGEMSLELLHADGAILPMLVNAAECHDAPDASGGVRLAMVNMTGGRHRQRALLDARQAADRANAALVLLNRTLEEQVAGLVEKRLQAEDALRQSQKVEALGQLTSGVAHDFNNLLTVIGGSAAMLARGDLADERRLHHVEAIIDTVARGSRLTGQLLAFARRQALEPRPFDVGHALAGTRYVLGSLLGPMIALAVRIPDAPCLIMADPNQFDTAIINMALNARDAMRGQGSLTITVGQVADLPSIRGRRPVAADFVTLSIADTGSGIDDATLERIFEPFFTTKPLGQGTGLGLAQVFGFARQSGGDVAVESTPGHGSVFTLYLPDGRSGANQSG